MFWADHIELINSTRHRRSFPDCAASPAYSPAAREDLASQLAPALHLAIGPYLPLALHLAIGPYLPLGPHIDVVCLALEVALAVEPDWTPSRSRPAGRSRALWRRPADRPSR